MQFRRATLQTCPAATGAVVVIDVIRAFTTAACAFARGAQEIYLVSTVEEAQALHRRFPDALLMGEVNGVHIPGFDFDNSPVRMLNADVSGRRLIQRTSAGTQGVVLSRKAGLLMAASFVCAAATVEVVRRSDSRRVTFVITGARSGPLTRRPISSGDEDLACADFLEARLRGGSPDPARYLERVTVALSRNPHIQPEQRAMYAGDLEICQDVDRFNFAMPVRRDGDLLRMEALSIVD